MVEYQPFCRSWAYFDSRYHYYCTTVLISKHDEARQPSTSDSHTHLAQTTTNSSRKQSKNLTDDRETGNDPITANVHGVRARVVVEVAVLESGEDVVSSI